MQNPVAQRDLLCAACGGQCAFSPENQSLVCHSCSTSQTINDDDTVDPTRELHYRPDTPQAEQTTITQTHVHQCETCGGEVVFVGAALSERCAYCDGPVVIKAQEASYQTLALVPFRVSQDQAEIKARAWASARIAAPGDLADVVAKGRVVGLYAPFWTFDSQEAVDYRIRHQTVRKNRSVTETVQGSLNMTFDDVLMPASPHVTPLIRDGIMHEFHPENLRPYDPAYLAGFAAERHHQTVPDGLQANATDKDLLIRNRIRRNEKDKQVSDIGYKTDSTGIRYRRILLPVWIVHYRFNGVPMKVVVCGIQGRTFGERPFSNRRLAGWAALTSLCAIALGWGVGAAQII